MYHEFIIFGFINFSASCTHNTTCFVIQTERLCNVIIPTGQQSGHFVLLSASCSQEQDWTGNMISNRSAKLQAIHIRHIAVQQNQYFSVHIFTAVLGGIVFVKSQKNVKGGTFSAPPRLRYFFLTALSSM